MGDSGVNHNPGEGTRIVVLEWARGLFMQERTSPTLSWNEMERQPGWGCRA